MNKTQKAINECIQCYADALRRGLVTPEEAFCAISEYLNAAYKAWMHDEPGAERVDKRAALHKAFCMLAEATKD